MKVTKQILGVLICGVLVLSSAPTVSAYTYSESARIAELQATIERLQAELARLQASSYSTNSITTGDVRLVGSHSVELKGVAPGRSGDSVYGWFEYGPTYALTYSTPMTKVTSGRSFYGIADDIDKNRLYYYRAVTESKSGYITEGIVRTFKVSGNSYDDWDDDWDNDWNEDYPEVETEEADDVNSYRAEISGSVDMQDYEDGLVFFVYGEDEDMVEDVEDEDQYSDIDTDGDDLRKLKVDSSFDDDDDFYAVIGGLDDNTDYYFRICVEFEDEDNDDRLVCGDVEHFETD